MIISDLNHLEVVSEASSVVGGSYKVDKYKFIKIDVDITKKSNYSNLYQEANAVAQTYKGDAKAVAFNKAVVVQSN